MDKKNNLFVFFILLFVSITIAHLLNYISRFIAGDPITIINYFQAHTSLTIVFISSILIAPPFETLIAQYLPIEIILRNFNGRYVKYFAVFLSGLIFGLLHFYNWLSVIAGFLLGLTLGINYLYFKRNGKAVLFTVLLHASYNLYAFLISDVFRLA